MTVNDVDLAEDFAATWNLNELGNALEVIAYRDPHPASTFAAIDPDVNAKTEVKAAKQKSSAEPGFFEATAQLSAPIVAKTTDSQQGGHTVVVLMDTSLSMQWEKLERSYAAAAKLLGSLPTEDRFNLLLFNTKVDSFRPSPVKADPATVAAAMTWLQSSHLRGGTDLQKALQAGLAQAGEPSAALVLLTDGGADRGLVHPGKLAAWYEAQWKQLPAERRPKTDVFAVGDDASVPPLRLLSNNDGVLEQVLSSEPVD